MSISVFFKSLTLRFLTNRSIEITWEMEQSLEPLDNVSYVVYRSENPENVWVQQSPELVNLLTYRDYYDGELDTKWRVMYYKVRASLISDPTKYVDSPIKYSHENPFDDGRTPFADPVLDIVRRNDLLLQHDRYRLGKPCIVYQKRTTGARCKCWDPVTQRVTTSQCPKCLGTGRIEGYHAGIEDIYVNFTSLAKQKMIQAWGDSEPGDTQAWMSNFPLVRPEDIIINKLTGDHWIVKRVRTSVHLIVSKQTILVRKVNFDDIKINLNFDGTKNYTFKDPLVTNPE
jgi:hypothetical protein